MRTQNVTSVTGYVTNVTCVTAEIGFEMSHVTRFVVFNITSNIMLTHKSFHQSSRESSGKSL